MATYLNDDDLERFRRSAGGAFQPNIAPTVLQKTQALPPRRPGIMQPKPGFTYQLGTPGYESLNMFQRLGQQPHYNVAKPTPTSRVAAPVASALPPAAPTAAPTSPIQQLYEFLKRDLTRESQQARSAAEVNAASRGVYYGEPLTAMGKDIDERYTRGLAGLQASLIQNEQQNELERLRLALSSLGPMAQPETPQFPTEAFSNLAAAFMPQSGTAPVGNAPATPPSYKRAGGKIRPATGTAQ